MDTRLHGYDVKREAGKMMMSGIIFAAGCALGFALMTLFSRNSAAALNEKYNQLQRDYFSARETVVALETEKRTFDEKLQMFREEKEKTEEKFRLQFENLANRIFDEKTAKFKKDSEEGLGNLLNPLKEKIQEFQKKVDDSFGQQAKEQFSLKNEITRIVEANAKITAQTESLTNALKGDTKVQGNWGEVMLEKILDDSGLRKDRDYILQGTGLGMKSEDGTVQKPDAVVMLPDDKHIIIDSKVSLTHYERYISESDDAARQLYLKQFVGSVKTHISGLEKRRYQDNDKMGTPDFVLMFIPIEGAYALAVQSDTELHGFAWDKRIVLVCPSTLFATLRTVASLWRIENQNRNALEIARQGGDLYDKISAFVGDMDKIGNRIKSTQDAYDEAYKKLSAGKGNIISRTEKLKELGVKTSKKLSSAGANSGNGDEDNDNFEEAANA